MMNEQKIRSHITAIEGEIGFLKGVASVLRDKMFTRREGEIILASIKRLEDDARSSLVEIMEVLTTDITKDETPRGDQ